MTLGELDFEELNTTNFLIFVVFTTLITLVLMNLLIAILSDAYELVTSEKKYYDGVNRLHRSLMYERLAMFFVRLFKKWCGIWLGHWALTSLFANELFVFGHGSPQIFVGQIFVCLHW